MLLSRNDSRRRRSLRVESLDPRRVLANLAVEIRFLASDQVTELTRPVLVGETFFVEIAVQDQRTPTDLNQAAAGVIGLPLNVSWNPSAVRLVDADRLAATGSTSLAASDPLVTPDFPLLRSVGGYFPDAPEYAGLAGPAGLADFNLRTVRGGSLPSSGLGSAIGVGNPETFSRLEFIATAVDTAMQLTVNLDGSLSFADAAQLDAVVGIDPATTRGELMNTVEATIEIIAGSIAGTKFNDLNGDGIRQAGEPGRPGIDILLNGIDAEGATIPQRSATTNETGAYAFESLAAGTYSLSEMIPSDSQITAPANNLIANLVLGSGQPTIIDQDFGNFFFASISGFKFEDLDNVGVHDADEPPIAGVEVILDLNGDGATTPDRMTLTDANGRYRFDNVPPGTHTIREVVPAGFTQTFPVATGTYVVTPTSGEVITARDFGNRRIPTPVTTVTGTKFNDLNGDGVRQADEPGVPGITIRLDLDNNGSPDRTVMTGVDGMFVFEEVPAGTHRVDEIVPNGGEPTTVLPLFVTVIPPTPVTALLIGNFIRTRLSGVKSEDTNGDGISDVPQSGVTIELDLNNDMIVDRTSVTDGDGRYEFINVGPGTHRISEIVPPNFVSPPSPPQYVIENRSGEPRTDLDFVNTRIVRPEINSVSGFVYIDANFNGVFDSDEYPIPGITLALVGSFAAPRTTTTDAMGRYVFNDVPNDTVSIEQTQPRGFADASITLGTVTPPGMTIGSTVGLNQFTGLVLTGGQVAENYNFGEVLTAVTKRMFVASTNITAEIARIARN